jgi:hypothetical protein
MDRHRFDADLDPDLTFHFDADLNTHPTSSFKFYTCWKKTFTTPIVMVETTRQRQYIGTDMFIS